MSDLIDRKQAILAVCSVCSAVRPEYRGEKCIYFADGCEEIERLNELPTARVMNDLIDRQAAIDAMTSILWLYPNECYRNLNVYEFAKKLAELGLKSVPSAQPEIVRCKDCKWNNNKEWVDCFMNGMHGRTPEKSFCSYGERKE